MVNDTTFDLNASSSAGMLDEEEAKLQAAYAKAMAQYTFAQQQAAQVAIPMADDGRAYSQHEVPGVGRYVIPKRTGWQFLLDIIHDPVPNIDFSANIYPNFDGIIGQNFNNTRLLDPLDDHYMSYESLRDNLAAVRNFLIARYFAEDSQADAPAAKKHLEEIAAFIGDAFYNNHYFRGIIPNHDPNKPFIDLDRAKEKGGTGAQYIYECILAHNRHSSGFRPLDAIKEMFGGKKAPNWNLPDADMTHFDEMFHNELPRVETNDTSLDGINAAIADAAANMDTLQARIEAVRDQKALANKASDLDNIANHLIFTATHMDGVAQLDEPIRRRAVDIAKDILKNLKFVLGDALVDKGLALLPSEDTAVFGSIKSVAKIYGRLLAWARNNNDSAILQNPAVLMATQAIGQLGYLAKQEALRMATLAGDSLMANSIGEQLKLLPASYIPKPGTKFGELIDTIQSGMDVILNRTQQVVVDGGQIGHSLDGDRGGVSTVPTAGMGNQVGIVNGAGRNQQVMLAADLAAHAEAQRITNQATAQSRRTAPQGQATASAAPSRSSSGRQALGTAKAAKQSAGTVSASRVNPTGPLTPAQMNAARGNTANGIAARQMAMHGHHDEHEEEHEATLLRQQQLQAQLKANNTKAKAAVAKIDPAMLKGFSMKGVTGAPITPGRDISPKGVMTTRAPGVATQTIKTQSVDGNHIDHSHDTHVETHVDHSQDHHEIPPVQQPVPPTRGGGRGF